MSVAILFPIAMPNLCASCSRPDPGRRLTISTYEFTGGVFTRGMRSSGFSVPVCATCLMRKSLPEWLGTISGLILLLTGAVLLDKPGSLHALGIGTVALAIAMIVGSLIHHFSVGPVRIRGGSTNRPMAIVVWFQNRDFVDALLELNPHRTWGPGEF